MKKILNCIIAMCLTLHGFSQTYNQQRGDLNFEASNYATNFLGIYDFNGDGLDDILIGGANGIDLNKTPVFLLINQGNGSFTEDISNFVNGDLKAANPYSINADYNNDGIMDFAIFDKGHGERGQDPVYTGFYGEDAQLLLSNLDGTWDISSVLADTHASANEFNQTELHIKSGSAADLNNDGYIDIYVESGGGSKNLLSHIYYNNGDNTFTIGKLNDKIWGYPFKGPTGLWRQQANAFADVNNDGYQDLLVGQLRRLNNEQEGLTSYVILNDGNGEFLESGAIVLPHPDWHEGYTFVKSILPIDLNLDGWVDLIYCQERAYDDSINSANDDGFTGNYMQVYINVEGQEFVDRTQDYMNLTEDILTPISEVYGKNNNSGFAKLVDMNEDSFMDIFVTSGPPVDKNNPLIYFNDGTNFFNPAPYEVYNSITNGDQSNAEYSYPVDFNADGLMDFVSSDLRPGPDDNYGTGDEYSKIDPTFGVRNYPKVTGISISSGDTQAGGLNLIFIPDLGISHFYFGRILGGALYTASGDEITEETFIERSIAEEGFLFTPNRDFEGNAIFYIQGATGSDISNLVGSKFITKIEVTIYDEDNDGVLDENDNCKSIANPDQTDMDNDGIGDVCDDDIDGDGILNEEDNCPELQNENQEDVDNDGIGDFCDDDIDGDGILNDEDNCMYVSNENQNDFDNDGIGDFCDDDIDGDGILNINDTCSNTEIGAEIDSNGCSIDQLDDDMDGVPNVLDLCPDTSEGKNVDVNGCILFDSNNFTIESISETCPDRNNGLISITAQEINNYEITLNETVYIMDSSSKVIDNLEHGNYELCIVIPNQSANYCYNIEIEEGNVISAKSTTSKNKTTVEVEKGTAPFEVYVNGESILKTQATVFDVEVKHGDVLEVKSAISCEGVYSKSIQMLDEYTVFPNPTNGLFEISIPDAIEVVEVEIYNNNSQLLSKKKLSVRYGKIQMDMTKEPSGLYLLKVLVNNPVTLKIIKN